MLELNDAEFYQYQRKDGKLVMIPHPPLSGSILKYHCAHCEDKRKEHK